LNFGLLRKKKKVAGVAGKKSFIATLPWPQGRVEKDRPKKLEKQALFYPAT